MKREQLSKIICDLDDRQIAEACRFDPALCKGSPGRIVMLKRKIIPFALAAVLLLALGAGAYALASSLTVSRLNGEPAIVSKGESQEKELDFRVDLPDWAAPFAAPGETGGEDNRSCGSGPAAAEGLYQEVQIHPTPAKTTDALTGEFCIRLIQLEPGQLYTFSADEELIKPENRGEGLTASYYVCRADYDVFGDEARIILRVFNEEQSWLLQGWEYAKDEQFGPLEELLRAVTVCQSDRPYTADGHSLDLSVPAG